MSILRASSLAFAATLVLAAAHASTVRTGRPGASQPPASTWATREQLRDCLAAEAALKERLQAIEASGAAHEKLLEQTQAEAARLQALQAQLDRDDVSAVTSYNTLVKQHNRHVQEINQDANDARPATDAYNADMADYNRRCSALRYRVEDMAAVVAERQKAAASTPP
jgi:uncharacterized protein YhaN